MNLSHAQFKTIDLNDPFFTSLKADYTEFSDWFARKAEDKAYVFKNSKGLIDGFLYLKVEDGPVNDVEPPLPPARRIKIGTFKINAHGTKLGERFIKKIFDHTLFEKAEEIYVTVFEHHAPLVNIFKRYGFDEVSKKTTSNGTELVLVRKLHALGEDVVADYPLVLLGDNNAYMLSLHPEWHTRLLPDSILKTESSDIVKDVSHTNSIHKVYLAAMKGMDVLKPGDVLMIYRTTDGKGPARFRSVVTSICVVEEYRRITSFINKDEFIKYCKPYSVFTESELQQFWERKKYPHIIRFTYNIALKKRPTRGQLIDEVGIDGEKYWGFMKLTRDQFMNIVKRGMIDESLIVNKA